MVGSHGLTERLDGYAIHDKIHLSYIYSKQLHITILEDSNFKVHIYTTSLSHENKYKVAAISILAKHFHTWEKRVKWRR